MNKVIAYRQHMRIMTLLLFLVLLLVYSCQSSQNQDVLDEEVMVAVPSSELYVRVRGNPDAPLIINLHGGPGGYSGIDIKLMGPALEDEFLLAYLDQRGCGKSMACTDTSMLTVDQYVKDLDLVVDSLRIRYAKEKVHLVGTSWGGMYGFLYLLQDQSKIMAYACIDGKVNSDFAQFHSDVNWMKHVVPARLGFNAHFADTAKIISFKDVIEDTALLRLMRYTPEEYALIGEKAEVVNAAFRNTPSYNNINIEPELKHISTPTLIIQGEQDYVVGVGHAELIYNALSGLSSNKKEMHIMPGVGHCPAIESPGKLSEILLAFFQKEAL